MPSQTSVETIVNRIEEMGFEAAIDRAHTSVDALPSNSLPQVCIIGVEGMTCNSCVKNIEGRIIKT